eukprot:TRINITY_DN15035_c0_g1_i1.p1 TRINITY_DN15035_c0_g1~~TRINITY_DN15035_c0_g1_i1.p1  ORF type:complete len:191 (+),score=35.68 TRINITY_DN15035_c0_g1_i1:71-643(+)
MNKYLTPIPVGIIVISYLFHKTVELGSISGGSMEPTIKNGSKMIYTKLFSRRKLKRGDIIITKPPHRVGDAAIKRIIAISGDVITKRDNGKLIQIPPGHIWIEGDNSKTSIDSNFYGPIPKNLVIGKAKYIIRNDNFFPTITSVAKYNEIQFVHTIINRFKYSIDDYIQQRIDVRLTSYNLEKEFKRYNI